MFVNNYNKGLKLEQKHSLRIHSRGVPLLVEPKILRDLGCGQVDVASFEREPRDLVIRIYEIKNSPRLGRAQRSRLDKSAEFLSTIFDMSCYRSVIFSCLSSS
jgi:hypothetical protein